MNKRASIKDLARLTGSTKGAKKSNRYEDDLQRAIVRVLRIRRLHFCAVPNGGARSNAEAAIMVGLGTEAGACDLLVFTPPRGFSGLGLELKAPNGKISPRQSAFHISLRLCGWRVEVVDDMTKFLKILEDCYG